MPQVLRPRQPEVPKQPEAPRQPERPKPPEAPRQPERPKPPEMPKPETVKRPDPPKPPTAPKQTPKTPEKQNSSRSPVVEIWEELWDVEIWEELWENMSTFARILFAVGLFGVIMYGVKLVLVLVGARELEYDVVALSIPFLNSWRLEIPLSLPVCFISFLLMVMKLALVYIFGGPRGAMSEFDSFLSRVLYWVIRAVVLWSNMFVSCAALSGQDGGLFELGAVACVVFHMVCIFGPATSDGRME